MNNSPSADPLNLAGLPLFSPDALEDDQAVVRNRHFLTAAGGDVPSPAAPPREAARGRRQATVLEPPRTTWKHSPREQYLAYLSEQKRRQDMRWTRLNWDHVALIQSLVADKLSGATPEAGMSRLITEDSASILDAAGRAELEQRGRALISKEVADQTRAQFNAGTADWDDEYQELLREGVFISQFRLGRLQLLLDRQGVEDIIINGPANIWLRRTDGTLERIDDALADSNGELERMLQRYGQANTNGARTISSSSPMMNMTLPGGERLAAVMPPLDKNVSITIRKHNLIDIDMETLREAGTTTEAINAFLTAANKAGLNITIAGLPAAGKTTFLRALCNVLPPDEPIATIEDVRELHLDLMDNRHYLVLPWQSVEGAGAFRIDGTRQGDIGLADLVYQSLRHSVRRILVGEVRSKEILPMFEASRAGTGSLSTIHAEGADSTIHRMAKLYMKAQPGTDPAIAYEEVGDNLDIVVYVVNRYDPATGKRRRIVAEISEVTMGEKEGRRWPVHKKIFAAGATYQATPTGLHLSDRNAERLLEHGFNQHEWLRGGPL
ncbi:pilus assembly protein CpaF [Arthrobacter sp. GAS37]|uniref:CpaF family protein n=1 Tax=Arthrobacter sp. GAS37 TaxID=3156261 RepID=UPI003833C7BD